MLDEMHDDFFFLFVFFSIAELCCSVHRFKSENKIWRPFAPPCGDYNPHMRWNCTVLMLCVPPSQLTSKSVCSAEDTGRNIQVKRTKISAAQLLRLCSVARHIKRLVKRLSRGEC